MLTDGTMFNEWVNVTGDSLSGLWGTVLGFLPQLIGALVVFIIGLIIASLLEKVVERVVFYLKIDAVMRKAEIEGYLERANMKLNSGKFVGKLVYWFVLVAFLLAASDILKFGAFSEFLKQVLNFIPNVLIAALIMVAALVVANFLRNLVVASVAGAKLTHGKGLGVLVWWIVVIFGILTALPQVGVNTAIIQTLVTGLIAMLALAGGLAFGLGGRDRASKFIERWGNEMHH
jgi:hypothetical protein